MINILFNGCNGRMGNVIADIVEKRDDCQIICGVDVVDNKNHDFPVYTSFCHVPADTKIDIIIDFSHFSALNGIIEFVQSRNIPVVLATTGYSSEDLDKIKALSEKVAVFRSANMSIGISLLKNLVQKAATFLGDDFDIEIVERHHNQKLDAPSGTALAIADAINEADNNKYEYIYDRHSRSAKRSKHEIGISAVRGGNIVGDHEVIFAGNNEILEINHKALSRGIFGEGAVKAALYLWDKPVGMYNMDMLAQDSLDA
ncbi:MAG: 4-hydroxy-tetrahydrodipicolinate reductase [Ruminococcaceae bacterium]|nr:4-hydroxy-tetrahydrodipicolinate reductase [Oscillospiraceae bacterium]